MTLAVPVPVGAVLVQAPLAATLARLLRLGIAVDRERNGKWASAEVEAAVAALQAAGTAYLQGLSAGQSGLGVMAKAAGRSRHDADTFSTAEAAGLLGVTPTRVGQLVKAGALSGTKGRRGEWQLEVASVESYRAGRGAA